MERRLLTVTPTRRDGEVTRALLGRAGIECVTCDSLASLAGEMARGVGAVMLTDIAALDADMPRVLEVLRGQPAWSDIPVLVLTPERERAPVVATMLDEFSNVVVLDRPVSARSMVSACLAALRARGRQFQIRDELIARAAAEDALHVADRRKDEFIATLAHELRNPLAPIRTALEVLPLLPPDSARAGELQQMMKRQVAQLVRLIDDLLDVSRITTGKIALQVVTTDLRDVVHAAVEGCRPAIDLGGHRLEVSLPEDAVPAEGDPSRLAQVVGNLLGNAAKYTPEGGRIEVALQRAGGQAVIRVTDDGIGIPADMLGAVFEVFTQVDSALAYAQGGLGIGLSLVDQLTRLHGGTVEAESAGPGLGSTFTVRLPLGAAEPDVGVTTAPAATDGAVAVPLRVLVVDDNRAAADAMAIALSLGGHATRVAYSGAGALEGAAAFAPDVVVCDIGLPDFDGYEVARRLRQREGRRLFLVALTGWGTGQDRDEAHRAGFDAHLTKPATLDDIDALLAGDAIVARGPRAEAPAGRGEAS